MSLPSLTPDLVIEIFSRLPVKSLVRFKCVSKYYNELISKRNFIKLHLERSPKNTHVLVTLLHSLGDEGETIWEVSPFSMRHLIKHPTSMVYEDECHRFTFTDGLYHAVGSINGLVCFIGQKHHERKKYLYARFWNPTLRLTSTDSPNLMIMPPPPNDMMLARIHRGFGYDISTNTYKLVAVFWDRTTEKWEGRVHCMGKSCWRKTLACPDFPVLLKDALGGSFVNDSINWLARHSLNCHMNELENVVVDQLVILSLDMRMEACKYVLLPVGFDEMPQNGPNLAVLRGRMCLYYYDQLRSHFALWEMREYGVHESWTQLVNISSVQLLGNLVDLDSYHHHFSLLLPVCVSEEEDVVLLVSKEDFPDIMYSMRDDRVRHGTLLNNQIWYAHEHMQSLVLPGLQEE